MLQKNTLPFELTKEFIERLLDDNDPAFALLEEDFISECNGDTDAINSIVFEHLDTGVLYRIWWYNDGFNYVGDVDMDYVGVYVVREIQVPAYVNTVYVCGPKYE